MKPSVIAAIIIFTIVALVQITRLYFEWPVMIDSLDIPLWVSIVGTLVPGMLAFWLWLEARPRVKPHERAALHQPRHHVRHGH